MAQPAPQPGCLVRLLRGFFIVVGLLLALLVLVVLVTPGSSSSTATPQVTPQAIAQATPLPTATPAPPTATPLPTDTPLPASTPVPTATPWYSGGTLHKASWAEWQAATHENKMATAADWITNGYEPDWQTVDELHGLSSELVQCVDEMAETASAAWGPNSSIVDIAVTCVLLMME